MELSEYEVMYRHEEAYWWYVALRDAIGASVARWGGGPGPLTLLDAGCGTGRLLEEWRSARAFGLEASPEAFRFLRGRSLPNLVQGSVCRMPYRDEAFDVVVSADVLCCVGAPGDGEALREIGRVLRPGGVAVLNLPAYEALRSHHDRAVHTRRRYTRAALEDLVVSAGLRPALLTYRNALLLPVAAAVRLAQRWRDPAPAEPRSDLRPLPAPVNRLLLAQALLENRLVRAGVRLPFGLSLFCVARKPPAPAARPVASEESDRCVLSRP